MTSVSELINSFQDSSTIIACKMVTEKGRNAWGISIRAAFENGVFLSFQSSQAPLHFHLLGISAANEGYRMILSLKEGRVDHYFEAFSRNRGISLKYIDSTNWPTYIDCRAIAVVPTEGGLPQAVPLGRDLAELLGVTEEDLDKLRARVAAELLSGKDLTHPSRRQLLNFAFALGIDLQELNS